MRKTGVRCQVPGKHIRRGLTERLADPGCDMKTILTHVLVDLLTGLLASGLYVLFSLYSFDWRGMGTMFAAAGLLFICAGFLRGASVPAYSGLKALLLTAPFSIVLMFVVQLHLQLVILAVIAISSAVTGIYARRSWKIGGRTRSLFILGAAFGILDLFSLVAAPILAQKMTTRTVNVPAPEISAMRLNGRSVESSQFKGTVTVLYFWATWCPPCWQEFPKVEKLYERYASNHNVVFLAIDAGEKSQTAETARAFIEDGAYRIPAAFDDRRAAATLRIRSLPCLLVLDKSWHVRLVHAGHDGSERFVANVSKVIDQLVEESQR